MKPLFLTLFLLSFSAAADDSAASYKIKKGQLHKGGKVLVEILPDTEKFKVRMKYDVDKKDFVPVPAKLLKGETVMEFPQKFRTEEGYQDLEKVRTMDIPKARLKFVRKIDLKDNKHAYLIKVLPTNKKTEIDITYNPELPSVGWSKVKITFISNFPILDGYVIEAQIR